MGNAPTNPPVDNVEAGYTTTEFWLTSLGSAGVAVFGLLAAFGMPLSPDQKSAVLAAVPIGITLAIGAYSLGRSLRKKN